MNELMSRHYCDNDLNYKEDVATPFRMMESEGTLKLFELSPIIYKAIKENRERLNLLHLGGQ